MSQQTFRRLDSRIGLHEKSVASRYDRLDGSDSFIHGCELIVSLCDDPLPREASETPAARS